MTRKTPGKDGDGPAGSREDRLKAALKANLARRKAQTRARQQQKPGGTAGNTQDKDDT
jgi:hypothetical protein